MKYINSSLITLKLVLFLFFGGIGCLFPFLPLHMINKGLSWEELKIVSIYAPLVAVIGPIFAGVLADRFAGSFGGAYQKKTGTYLRLFIAVCLLLAALFYALLAAVPKIEKSPPSVAFVCDETGSYILQERCGSEKICYNWDGATKGSLLVTNCRFTCNVTVDKPGTNDVTTVSPDSDAEDDTNYDIGSGYYLPLEPESDREIDVPPSLPHLCYQQDSGLCEVYTPNRQTINLQVALNPHDESNQRTISDENICTYTSATPLKCRIPTDARLNNPECQPVVKCSVHSPYNSTGSLLKVSQCGYNNNSLYLYLLFKSLGDIFTAAAVTLLSTAVVIATRETSTGRGDVGKQFAVGSLGLAIFAPIIGGLAKGQFGVAVVSLVVLFVLAALILVFDFKMPLSPPEWWWHTKCGLLALPMSAVRKYGLETCALGFVLFLLGVFWSALDSYLPYHILRLEEPSSTLIIGLTITVGALPAIPYLFFAEKIIDYCGHANLLIICFVNYIIHYAAFTLITNAPILLIPEALEIFTLHLMWVTAVVYLRHLVPRKFTACGQALPVITHFCLGRFVGSILGGIGYTDKKEDFSEAHGWFAFTACVIAIVYFLLYNVFLKPHCAAPIQHPPTPSPAIVQSVNGSRSYTPLRVYHNGRAKKGQFRY